RPNDGRLSWTLSGPSGVVVSGTAFPGSDRVLDLVAGLYTLTVDIGGDATGPYAFRLIDPASAPALSPGTPVSGTLSPANETEIHCFDAQAGDRFTFDILNRTGAVNAS